MRDAQGTEKVCAESEAVQQRVTEGEIHPGKDLRTMHKQMMGLAFCLAAFAVSASAQTGTVPLDAGTPPTGLTNSSITELNGNVGIGTAITAGDKLDVGGHIRATGDIVPGDNGVIRSMVPLAMLGGD